MTFDLHQEAREQVRSERKDALIKKYRDTRSQLLQAKQKLEAAQKEFAGLETSLAKTLKEGEDEYGPEWH